MWKNRLPDYPDYCFPNKNYQTSDYQELLRYVNELASHKLGYPVSLLTYLGVVDNRMLGIQPGSLANILLNNVGDPFKDSETSLLEVKKHEREVISILEDYYGLDKGEARGYVTTGGTEGNFASLWWSKRYLINCALDELINVDNKIKLLIKEEQQLTSILMKISITDYQARAEKLQTLLEIKDAISENKNIVQQLLTPTVFFTKAHTHYSVPKIAEILRLNIQSVEANQDGSIDLNDFNKKIILHISAHPKSAIIVIANIGTTITGAIDDVQSVNKILKNISVPTHHTIHMDGALTGFVLPILRPFENVTNYFDDLGVNTLAVSAHKYPGLSQPCGIILARRKFFEKAFEKSERSIEYVGNIVDVTITGSRSGLNVLMFYNALKTFELDKNNEKLRKMVNKNIKQAKYIYDNLVDIYGQKNVYYPYHFNIIFPRPSMTLAKKYQLMVTGDKATICILTNVTQDLINQFIRDLRLEKEAGMNIDKLNIKLDTLKEEHSKQVIDLLTKSFCDSEPITKHLGIHYHEYIPFATEVVQKAVKEGFSKVALDQNNKVIACTIAEDMADPFVPHLAHYPKMQPVIQLIEALSKPFKKNKKFVKGKIIHVWLVAVDQTHRGEHLSTITDMACIDMAAHKGFDFAYAEFTNERSEKVTNQFRVLELCNRIKFDDFRIDENEKPFQGLQGSADAYIATIRPGVNLNTLNNCYKSL